LTKTEICLREWKDSEGYSELIVHDSEQQHRPSPSRLRSMPQLMSLADPYGPMWDCLRQLCEKTYWTRLWIVQELVKAKELLLVWGDEQVSWAHLSAAFRTIELNNELIRTSESRFAPWDVVKLSIPYQVWLQRDGPQQKRPLLDLMETYRASGCSELRDKAYALTGISSDSHLLPIDYATSLPDLYVNLMRLVQDEDQCAKYSHLILRSLGLDPIDLLSTSVTSLRGHKVKTRAIHLGKVEFAKTLSIQLLPVNIEMELYELMLHASAQLGPAHIDGIIQWGQDTHQALRQRFQNEYTDIYFFWSSSGQLGAALAPVPIDHAIYRLPGITGQGSELFLRVDDTDQDSEDPGSARSPLDSPVLSSPSQSSSTFFSETIADVATRVWVSNVGTPSIPDGAQPTAMRSIEVPLIDLVAADRLLAVELKAPLGATVMPIRERRGTKSDGARRRSTKESASITEVIDSIMGRTKDGSASKLQKSSTWPTPNVSHVFVDALSRQLRDALFRTDRSSSLGIPD
jgi:hypothetical protein